MLETVEKKETSPTSEKTFRTNSINIIASLPKLGLTLKPLSVNGKNQRGMSTERRSSAKNVSRCVTVIVTTVTVSPLF